MIHSIVDISVYSGPTGRVDGLRLPPGTVGCVGDPSPHRATTPVNWGIKTSENNIPNFSVKITFHRCGSTRFTGVTRNRPVYMIKDSISKIFLGTKKAIILKILIDSTINMFNETLIFFSFIFYKRLNNILRKKLGVIGSGLYLGFIMIGGRKTQKNIKLLKKLYYNFNTSKK